MSKKHKIFTALGVAVHAVVIVIHIIDGNLSAVCGWICAAVWFAMARWHEDRTDKFHKGWARAMNTNIRLLERVGELKAEIGEYEAKIRAYETEGVDDGE